MEVVVMFAIAALVVIAAGIVLSYTADSIAEHTGLGRLAIGVILLAVATTLPEIVTDIAAVRIGAADLAVGDILGSCLMNMFILGLADLFHHAKHRKSLLSVIILGHARTATLSLVLIGIAGSAIISGATASIWGVGLSTIILAGVYIIGVRSAISSDLPAPQPGAVVPAPEVVFMPLRKAVIGFSLAAVAIAVAGPVLARSADHLAIVTGLGETFFGSIVLAFVTSLPELVASFTALRIRAFDLAVGNLFGSNCFNLASLFIFDVADGKGPLLAHVEKTHVLTAFIVIILTGLAMQVTMAHGQRRVWLVEPVALAMIMVFLAGVALMYAVH